MMIQESKHNLKWSSNKSTVGVYDITSSALPEFKFNVYSTWIINQFSSFYIELVKSSSFDSYTIRHTCGYTQSQVKDCLMYVLQQKGTDKYLTQQELNDLFLDILDAARSIHQSKNELQNPGTVKRDMSKTVKPVSTNVPKNYPGKDGADIEYHLRPDGKYMKTNGKYLSKSYTRDLEAD